MISHTCSATAESSGSDARAEAQYLPNEISADFLQMGDVLQSTKPAAEGLIGRGLCGFDARYCSQPHHAESHPVPSLAFCDLHPREVSWNYPDLEASSHELTAEEASVNQIAAEGFGDAGHQLRKSSSPSPNSHPRDPVAVC